MNNTRFATIIHILSLLAKNPDQWVNSEWIAESLNVNPVIVRKELLAMQKQGWVVSKKGKDGGSKLDKPCGEISLADIYHAVRTTNVLGKINKRPGSDCPIGKNINQELEKLFKEIDELLAQALQGKDLEGFVSEFD